MLGHDGDIHHLEELLAVADDPTYAHHFATVFHANAEYRVSEPYPGGFGIFLA